MEITDLASEQPTPSKPAGQVPAYTDLGASGLVQVLQQLLSSYKRKIRLLPIKW